jgi:ABC-type methionine transport system permease subunit
VPYTKRMAYLTLGFWACVVLLIVSCTWYVSHHLRAALEEGRRTRIEMRAVTRGLEQDHAANRAALARIEAALARLEAPRP